jgi:hypothetical protein
MELRLATADYYLFAACLYAVPLLLLIGLDPDGVERRKIAEREALALKAAAAG